MFTLLFPGRTTGARLPLGSVISGEPLLVDPRGRYPDPAAGSSQALDSAVVGFTPRRERERERKKERERKREGEREKEREKVCVCV